MILDQNELRVAGWHGRGYLPHFDGRAMPQFCVPKTVIQRWREELKSLKYEQERIVLQMRIEKYLDQGYGLIPVSETSGLFEAYNQVDDNSLLGT